MPLTDNDLFELARQAGLDIFSRKQSLTYEKSADGIEVTCVVCALRNFANLCYNRGVDAGLARNTEEIEPPRHGGVPYGGVPYGVVRFCSDFD